MIINTVKLLKDDRIQIAYSNPAGDMETESIIKCPEKAAPEFYTTFREFESVVKKMCEFDLDTNRISVSGITFTYVGDDKIMGAKIHAKRKLITDEQMDIVTPYRYSIHPTDSTPDSKIMEHSLEELFVKIKEECKLYVNGKREQVKADI